MELKAIDPPDCGCTDCLTGYSKPLNEATQDDLLDIKRGALIDRVGIRVVATYSYEWKD